VAAVDLTDVGGPVVPTTDPAGHVLTGPQRVVVCEIEDAID
jgi:hypothetical protein